MRSTQLSQDEYKLTFLSNNDVAKSAFQHACEIRKFEIDLYWKRATYFWTLIGAAFVGYAAFFNSSTPILPGSNKELIMVLIACLGLVFSVAWHCVNKGSKFWQENWENHVELLEDEFIGPLYKTLTKRPIAQRTRFEKLGDFFTAPKPYSVSKINQVVSTYVVVIWFLILGSSVGEVCYACAIDWKKSVLVSLALLTCVGFWLVGKSHEGSHTPNVFRRETKIS